MNQKRITNVFSLLMIAALLLGASTSVSAQNPKSSSVEVNNGLMALPTSPTDESKVPHYFGPNTNWALSPLTLPDVTVDIVDPGGTGSGAAATATVGANGQVTSLTLTNPGTGYTAANVIIGGAGTGATASATVAGSGSVTSVTVTAEGSGYTSPTVTFSGGGGTGTLVQIGNSLVDRTYASDAPPEPMPRPVFVVIQKSLPTGTLTDFLSWNQATAASGPPSAGEQFIAYVLRPTGTPDQYTVVFASATLTVPALADPAVSELATYNVGNVPVLAGDVIGFYGAGIPLDLGQAAPDLASYPAPVAPALNDTVTLGSAGFPLTGDARTYSFAASVVDSSGVTPLTPATATAYGGVDAVTVVDGGLGYTMPVVDFDFPDDMNGTIAKAHAELDANGTITAVIVDDPGSGYITPPNVVIYDGPIYAPLNNRERNAANSARLAVIEANSGKPLSPAQVEAVGPAASTQATATATLKIVYVTVDTFGAGYISAPTVTINDPTGKNASAIASVNGGGVTGITLLTPGSGYITSGGIKKFTDPLPDLCDPSTGGCPTTGKYIPLGVPEKIKYPLGDPNGIEADQYEIGLVQYRTSFSSSLKDPVTGLPVGTLARGYVQLDTGCTTAGGPGRIPGSQCFQLQNELLDGTLVDTGYFGVTPPQWLGPTIAATKNKPVRIIFRNLLPIGIEGNLFMPVDTTLMGSGMGPQGMWVPFEDGTVMDQVRNPQCTTEVDPITGTKLDMCYKDNRATLHLHGGITPWISDGTPHQWITPANETTPWPQGVSVGNVPDMAAAGCDAADDGCMTFYYTNQQSARLQFYHDHAYGITRLNVMAGQAAGYVISDGTEKTLINNGTIPGAADTKVLVIQDRTFVAQDSQMYNVYDTDPSSPTYGQIISYGLDPTWDASRWGGYGSTWYHHVYMPAQNPGDPSGMSAYGRWMYGPWFWPPAANTVFGPIANPYYNMDPKGPDGLRGTADDWSTPLAVPCNLDDPTTWQYDTDPFCEPQQIPGTPNISVGMEQFNDTPTVNGVAYPTITLQPKTYRLRMLNAANDRFFNLQWYIADPSTLADPNDPTSGTEVAFNEAELAAAQTDPNVFPTPDTVCETGDTSCSLPGPDWIQIGNEGGFLPAPAVIDGQQVTTWITDPTRFDVGNVDKHSLLLAPAERADVIVDFSKFAGKTLILYNDGPAAFPARVPSYDYYTGAPDLSPNGAPAILPGYGPNTRTVMQVKIAAAPAATAFNLSKLQKAFSHKANGTGVFESGQHPIIVGQAAYNSAYGTSFASSSNCNAPGSTVTTCDGLVRISDTTVFGFNTLKQPKVKMSLKLEPKAIHDEMNATTFDDYGRMQATLGLEAQPPTPGVQNATLYPYVNPSTELIDATNLPKNDVVYDAISGLPVSDVKITPISSAADGTQIWRITHNGVDTHPVHFHLFDVQVLNRVAWDNIITMNDANELGWKETLRVAPLQDTIVALRPIIPELPWELPNAIRNMNPAMPTGATAGFNNVNPQGIPTAPIVNQLVNYGWEYVYHCHILSHEEMDMMRPVSAVLPPLQSDGLAFNNSTGVLTWNDNSINETSFVVQRSSDGVTWVDVGTSPSPLDQPNTHGVRNLTDTTYDPFADNQYRVVAKNVVGYGAEFPLMTVQSVSAVLVVPGLPKAPSNLTATLVNGPAIDLAWTDNATNETGFVIERAVNGGAFTAYATVGANVTTYQDAAVSVSTTYSYRVMAQNAQGNSPYSNVATVFVPSAVAAPTNLTAAILTNPTQVQLTWTDNATNETGFVIERSVNGGAFTTLANVGPSAGTGSVSYMDSSVTVGNSYSYRVAALDGAAMSAYSNTVSVSLSLPAAPSNVNAFAFRVGQGTDRVVLTWTDNANNETSFEIQRSTNAAFSTNLLTYTVAANSTTWENNPVARRTPYYYRIRAVNAFGTSAWVNATPFPITTP